MYNTRGILALAATVTLVGAGCSPESSPTAINPSPAVVNQERIVKPAPASKFDLSHWYLDVPVDLNQDGRADTISVSELQSYSHPDFFYLDEQNRMVFVSPNKATTTKTSTNTRSELRYMSRGANTAIPTSAPGNNFALAAHKNAANFASVGSKLEATLHVDHVSRNAGHPQKFPAYSVVIGQIHALKLEQKTDGFGYGNEPLKIFFKKWPDHDKGSVFWTYERNLPVDDPRRVDIAYSVWGNSWDNPADPGDRGVALGETFSYTVNVHENTMHLIFESKRHGTVRQAINLADNVDANGKVDSDDHPQGYTGDPLYFKAGMYNQCSAKVDASSRYPACPGTGDWKTDYAAGNYAKATFSRLVVSDATEM